MAQTFTNIYSFTGGSDGDNPYAGLILSGNTLYGTTESGGSSGSGTVFAINTDGTGFTNIYSFTALNHSTNSDGSLPATELVLSGNRLYGTAESGGGFGNGTVFAVNTDGTGFTNLHTFTALINSTNSDGAEPSSVILSGNTLYGTTFQGGHVGGGTVFRVNTDGSAFTNLFSFPSGNGPVGLVLSGNTLYGTTFQGGSSGNGAVFAINTDGSGFAELHNFTARSGLNQTNSDGANPHAGLILSGNTLYGTAAGGGSSGNGTVFAINTDGSGFTNLYTFTTTPFGPHGYVNSDGAWPYDGLILLGNTLYGTTYQGGSLGQGTVFEVNTDGSDFITLYNFDFIGMVYAGLILSDNTLYGTIIRGGSSFNGSVFALTLLPVIATQPNDVTVTVGSCACFTVLASSAIQQLSYQWYFNDTNTPVACGTNVTLKLFNVSTNEEGEYFCVVSNPNGSVTSDYATLTVLPLPVITTQPVSMTVTNGGCASFTVTASTDTPPLSYQWYFNDTDTPVDSETNATLNLVNVSTGEEGDYFCVVSNPNGGVTSDVAALTVLIPPVINSITQNPSDGSVTLDLSGGSGETYLVQVTTNLSSPTQWQTISTNVVDSDDGSWQFTDTDATNYSFQFYRISTQ